MFTLTIKTDNAAFQDNPNELSEILSRVARQVAHTRVDRGELGAKLMDSNGNTVGSWSLKP